MELILDKRYHRDFTNYEWWIKWLDKKVPNLEICQDGMDKKKNGPIFLREFIKQHKDDTLKIFNLLFQMRTYIGEDGRAMRCKYQYIDNYTGELTFRIEKFFDTCNPESLDLVIEHDNNL